MRQSTSHIFMVYPTSFGFNEETADSNHFQSSEPFHDESRSRAQREFEAAVEILRENGIEVTVFTDESGIEKPDAVFPNNWISIHPEGYVLYPMEAKNRRIERLSEIYNVLSSRFNLNCLEDLSSFENEEKFLEGTGSIIFDHLHRKAYASLSSRTNADLLDQLCKKLSYEPITFSSKDINGNAVYHTNVLMAIGTGYCILCEDAIGSVEERQKVRDSLTNDQIGIIKISLDQMYRFAGNMIELTSDDGQKFLIMSKTAYDSLTSDQIAQIKLYADPLVIDVSTIEKYGGGSIRCMIAELFF